jgi:phosphate starvation-inducible PhoH-like protein
VDLPSGTSSGLRIVQEILDGIEDVSFSVLDATDVVRHRLVSDIVDAYGRWDDRQRAKAERARQHSDRQRRSAGAERSPASKLEP